ncbi:HNH endonuclease domain-containing protein [Geminocystis sp. CENA526]|uniref:HNH endonuclease domain-containing protein n=1 Tax=Geminocystis sp. CENA526 TaxID=1355871 RepID=UPI003D6E17D6
MNINSQILPQSNHLNISALSRLFQATTNSYKYLFFYSILDILSQRLFDHSESMSISFQELMIEMLANAWYPHTFFRLSFGKQDKIANKLDSLDLTVNTTVLKFNSSDKIALKEIISQNNLTAIIADFKKNVPFRLLRPFLQENLRDFDVNYEVVKKTPEIANQYFAILKPLYRFNANTYRESDAIILHPEWVDYFKQNFIIIKGWVAWEWLQYMQKNNQNVPNLVNKLFAPEKRNSLTNQANYWKFILEKQPIKCIYSQQTLDKNTISIDHYLPWSFVAHDRLWNLIPTMNNVNSSKSNNIPSSQYLVKFIQLQHQGLTISHQYLPRKEWLKYTENYLLDLKISQTEDLLNLELLTNIYNRQFEPLISLAKIQGFNDNWTY